MLRTLWRVTQFADCELRRKLFLSYLFPHFIYADVVLFGMSKGCLNKLNRCFNACVRYVFKLKKFDHISSFSDRLIGCQLSTYFDFKICWFIKQLLRSKSPSYLFNKIFLSPNYDGNLRLILRHNNSCCSNLSFFVKGIRLWNSLPLCLRKVESRVVFFDRFVDMRRNTLYVEWWVFMGYGWYVSWHTDDFKWKIIKMKFELVIILNTFLYEIKIE